MKVFVVNGNCDMEYGCMKVNAIFSTKEKAEAYVAEHQWYWLAWWDDSEKDGLMIEEWEVE